MVKFFVVVFTSVRDFCHWVSDGPVLNILKTDEYRSEEYVRRKSGVEDHHVYTVLERLYWRGLVERRVDEEENKGRPMYREAIYQYRLSPTGARYVGLTPEQSTAT